MMLKLCREMRLGTVRYGVVQYAGEAVAALPMSERMVLTNMAAELGAQTGLIEPDAVTVAALSEMGVRAPDALNWHGDRGAQLRQDLGARRQPRSHRRSPPRTRRRMRRPPPSIAA